MRILRHLILLSLKRVRMLLMASGLLLGAFQVLLVVIAGSIEHSAAFEHLASLLPPFARAILGPAVASVMSFAGIVCLGYFHLAIVVALLALVISLATLPASEIELGFADLILARPLARHWLITRTIAVVLFSIAAMLLLMIGGTWIGLETLAPVGAHWPTARRIAGLSLNLGFLALCWSGIAMALGTVCRRSVASAITALLALLTLLLDLTGRLWLPAERLAWLSPFHYFVPFDLVMGHPLSLENLIVLSLVGTSGYTLAYLFFSQRDISR